MHHILIIKTAHHIHNGIGLTDICEELVAKPLTLGCASHQARNIHKLYDGRLHTLRLHNLGECIEARIRHLDDTDIGLDGAERVILGSNTGLGQRIEQSGFADVWQADDAAFETHGIP